MHQETINYLRLSRTQNIGNIAFFGFLRYFENSQNIIDNIEDYSYFKNSKKPIKLYPEKLAIKELEDCHKIGAQVIIHSDPQYPQLLKEISGPPPVITTLGDVSLLNRKIIAMVGTRNASLNGCKFAKKIAGQLGEANLVVSSGLARGIDTAAHIGSLNSGTIAVIAGGIDNIYPKENTNLYHQIAKSGVIISENKFGSPPHAAHFPQRNRIISGIALGTIVVEATLHSGTLITARCSLEQNREIFAVPGSPFDPRYQGTNKLIKEGAKLLETIDDVLEEIDCSLPNPKKEVVDQRAQDHQNANCSDEISRVVKLILEKMSYAPIAEDEIVTILNIPANIASIALTQMELCDQIERKNGKISISSIIE